MSSKNPVSDKFPLELNPESSLQFVLKKTENTGATGEGMSRCVMKLTNPTESSHFAFKVGIVLK